VANLGRKAVEQYLAYLTDRAYARMEGLHLNQLSVCGKSHRVCAG